ncbi:di-heme oxidoredictase family protein [Prosthecobacter sp.]|uniref:di-heme oxidoredictase family protein n=1 Tax=Prosthecobacter sp. TaxID=1965333 RepID=UPI0037835445
MKAIRLTTYLTFAAAWSFGGYAAAQQPPRHPSHRTQHPPHAPAAPPNAMKPPQFGDPLPGLTKAQMAVFLDGKEDFEDAETEAGGLGPIFNRNSCVTCHSAPATGGAGPINVTRFGRTTNGVFDPLTSLGGSLQQEMEINAVLHEVVPPEANVVAHRNSTPLFGLGLIEAIPDDQILRNVKRSPLDGAQGKVSKVADAATGKTLIGRFGWKAQQATLLSFAGDAYLNEMGITSRLFPVENAPNGNQQLLAQYDTVVDPEDVVDPATGRGDIDRVADFMRYLGAPPRLPLTSSAGMGRNVFQNTGCAVCHVPLMMTGPNKILALDRQEVWLFSDLLLHDMGTLGDGIAQGTADVRDIKTAPLWGLRASAPYLHDGRAATIDEAIKAHDGEGKVAKERYLKLTKQQVQQLIDFLNSI